MANPVADEAKGENERESVGVVGRTPKERDESLITAEKTGKNRIIWTLDMANILLSSVFYEDFVYFAIINFKIQRITYLFNDCKLTFTGELT